MAAQMQTITVPIIASIVADKELPPVAVNINLTHNNGGYGKWSGWCVTPFPSPWAIQPFACIQLKTKAEVVQIELITIEDFGELKRVEFKGVGRPPQYVAKFLPPPTDPVLGPLADMIKLDDDAPTFKITCLKCGSTQVEVEDSRRYYDSGGTGSLDLKCKGCENYQTISEAE